MEKLREEMAKLLFDWIDDDGWEWWEVDKDVRDHYRNKTDSILSLPALREALEKAEKWDALTKKYPYFCTRFDPEIDGEVKDETK